MRDRPLVGFVMTALLVFAVAATAAPAAHSSRHHRARHHRASGPALIVRGDQVSTEDLVKAVAHAFAETGDGHLEIQPFNTIDGIDQALSGQVDMAASARPAYPKRHQEAGLTFTPVAWDALVLVTNASNPVHNLSLRQVRDIYYGRITNWDKLGGPDEKIDLVGVFPKLDGVQFSFRRLLFGNGNNRVAVPRLLINIDALQSDVSLDPKALALSTLSHVRHQRGIKALSIEGVRPSLASVASGQYPLPLTIYLAWRADSPKRPAIEKFLGFLAGAKAGGILREHDLLPYAQATTLNAKTEMDRINAVGAYLVAEGLPAAYAPGNQFARLAGGRLDIQRTAALQKAAAELVAKRKAAAAQVAARTPAPSPAATAQRYTVQKGDTLSRIAQKYSVSVAELRRWNHLHGNMLRIGQVLRVSAHNP